MAFARVGIYKVKADQAEPVIAKGKAELPELMKRQPGFNRYAVLRTGPDEIVSLSSWETREQAEAAGKQLTDWVRQNGPDAFVGAENLTGEAMLNEQATEDAAKFGRVAVYKFAPGAADRVVARAREGFLPILKAQPGFVRYVIVKTGEDSGVSYTGWASKSQAEEAIDKAATWVKANLADLVGSVQNHVGEVLWSARR